MQYRSITDLNNIIIKNINKFPKDIDIVVGIPRSGMLPANLIALYLNKPFTDIDSFIDGKCYACGYRKQFIKDLKTNKILIVDDSINTGSAMTKAMDKLKNLSQYKFIKSAIFGMSKSISKVDICCEIIDEDRIFQWNLFHHPSIISQSCLDIDGVLCSDPTPEQNDDGEKYKEFLLNAEPKFIPTVKIKTLITCRLEKYRKETKEWLRKNNIQYENLIMLNLPDAQTRRKWGKYGEYKAKEYMKPQYKLFIESSLSEAKIIKSITNKSVFCIETMTML